MHSVTPPRRTLQLTRRCKWPQLPTGADQVSGTHPCRPKPCPRSTDPGLTERQSGMGAKRGQGHMQRPPGSTYSRTAWVFGCSPVGVHDGYCDERRDDGTSVDMTKIVSGARSWF